MISQNCKFDEFVAGVRDLDRQLLVETAAQEKREGMKIRESGRYVEILNGLIGLLQSGNRPGGVHPWEFAKMHPIIEGLVKRKQFKPEALSVFDETLQ